MDGYKLEIVDYLLKPFSYEEFLNAIHKSESAQAWTENSCQGRCKQWISVLKSDYKIKRINFNDILYIEGLKDYVKSIYPELTQAGSCPLLHWNFLIKTTWK